MTVSELIHLLEDHDPEAEVRIATQPSWPFESQLQSVAAYSELVAEHVSPDDQDEMDEDDGPEGADDCVYLFEGQQLAYLPAAAKTGWGW
jgi:hypothetical protein